MSKKTKNIEAAVIAEPTNEAAIIANENAIEALVPALEEAKTDATTEPAADAAADTTESLLKKDVVIIDEPKKRVRGYEQTAVSIEDMARLKGLKEHFKKAHNVTVSNSQIITAALDALAHDEHMKAFLTNLVTSASDKQRAKDIRAFEALKAKLEPATTTELAKA